MKRRDFLSLCGLATGSGIGIHYRAVGWKPDASTVEWVWIGSHADYDKLIR